MFTVQLSDGVYIVRFRTIKARERFGSILRRTNSIRDANRNNQNYALPQKQERPKTVICSILHKDATPHTWTDKGASLWKFIPTRWKHNGSEKVMLYDIKGSPRPKTIFDYLIRDDNNYLHRYQVCHIGRSSCNPMDEFDNVIGKKLSLARALEFNAYADYPAPNISNALFKEDERRLFWCEFWKWIKSWKPQPEFTIKDLSGSELVELDTEPDMVRRRSSVYECGDEEEATALSWNRKVISS